MNPPLLHRAGALSIRERSHEAVERIGALRVVELLLGALLVVQIPVGGSAIPLNEFMSVVLIVFALFRAKMRGVEYPSWLVPLLAVSLFYIFMISLFADPTGDVFDWKRRLIRIVLTIVLMLIIASGRLDARSLIVGLGVGIGANAILFYAGVAPDNYGGSLSGFFADKNVAGLAIAVWGLLFLGLVDRLGYQLISIGVAGGLLYLTGSRTSMAAFVMGVVWVLLAPRLPLLGKWVLGLFITIATITAAEDFSQIGRFSGRVGSDALRARIDAASEVKLGETGFFGAGLGEAYVHLQGGVWLFHNSFWTLLVEGGWPWLVCIVGITVFAGLRPFHSARLSRLELGAQAATIALLLCGWRLGEVILTQEWAIVVGIALLGSGLARRDRETVT